MSDPLALFRVLADPAPGLGGADDVVEVKRAVAAMRRGRRLASPSAGRRLLAAADWRRAAAVGVVTLGMLSLAAGGWLAAERDQAADSAAGTPAALEAARAAVAPALAAAPAAPTPLEEWARRPVFEGIDSPRSAAVYELAGENLDVVMVVDETLNI
jgi:hypothetical protein